MWRRYSPAALLQAGDSAVASLTCDPSAQVLAAAHEDGTVSLYDVRGARLLQQLQYHTVSAMPYRQYYTVSAVLYRLYSTLPLVQKYTVSAVPYRQYSATLYAQCYTISTLSHRQYSTALYAQHHVVSAVPYRQDSATPTVVTRSVLKPSIKLMSHL